MKSAFELYEKYETEKLRPKLNKNADVGMRLIIQDECSAAQDGCINLVYPALNGDADAVQKLERAAAVKNADGVVLNFSALENPQAAYEAAQRLIPKNKRVATVADCKTALMPFLNGCALLLEGEELEIRERLARTGLSARYQKAPVYLYAQGKKLLKCAEGWHVYAATGSVSCGPRLALRRVAFPKLLSSKGAMPVRVWLQNTGTGAEYRTLELRMYLKAGKRLIKIPLKARLKGLDVGDATINEITQLPELTPGSYRLLCGIYANGAAVRLCNACTEQNGLYEIGSVCIDNESREELHNAWQDYYPEGYYPLEDPKLPY